MEYFGIIKFRRIRRVFSKKQNAEVSMYDYVVMALNSDSNQGYPFSVNEEKNKQLMEQGLKEGALGTMYFYTEAKPYTGKDGQEQDYPIVYPTRFKPYQTTQNSAAQNAQQKPTNFATGANPAF